MGAVPVALLGIILGPETVTATRILLRGNNSSSQLQQVEATLREAAAAVWMLVEEGTTRLVSALPAEMEMT